VTKKPTAGLPVRNGSRGTPELDHIEHVQRERHEIAEKLHHEVDQVRRFVKEHLGREEQPAYSRYVRMGWRE